MFTLDLQSEGGSEADTLHMKRNEEEQTNNLISSHQHLGLRTCLGARAAFLKI